MSLVIGLRVRVHTAVKSNSRSTKGVCIIAEQNSSPDLYEFFNRKMGYSSKQLARFDTKCCWNFIYLIVDRLMVYSKVLRIATSEQDVCFPTN